MTIFFSSDRSSLQITWGKPCPNRLDEFSEMSFWWKYFDDIQHKYWPTCCFTSISMWRNNTEYQLESKFQCVVHIVYANPNTYQIQIQVQVSRYMLGQELSQMTSVYRKHVKTKRYCHSTGARNDKIVISHHLISRNHTLWNYIAVLTKIKFHNTWTHTLKTESQSTAAIIVLALHMKELLGFCTIWWRLNVQ